MHLETHYHTIREQMAVGKRLYIHLTEQQTTWLIFLQMDLVESKKHIFLNNFIVVSKTRCWN